MISIVIQGYENDCFDTCLCKDKKEIENISPFFKELVSHNEDVITLFEEEPSDAFTFLVEVLHNKGNIVDISFSDSKWNYYWAKLSQKWEINEFINHYSNKINLYIEKVLGVDPIEILGSSGPLALAINGTYESCRDNSDCRPSYKKSKNDSGEDILLEYNDLKNMWTIKSVDRSRTNTAGAYVDCDSFTTPDKVKNHWKVWNLTRWEYDLNVKVKVISKKIIVSEQELTDLWEMLELRFKFNYPQLSKNKTITTMSDLLWVLAMHREVWREESMKKLLSTDDWCSLSMKLASYQK